METPKKKSPFLFGKLAGQDVNTCDDLVSLKWYLGKLGPKHWQYWTVRHRIEALEFLAK